MVDAASELRYDPDEDDSRPSRGPSALMRILSSVAAAAAGAQTPADIYEQISRALAEHGIATVVLMSRTGGPRFVPLAHRLGVIALGPALALPGLVPTLSAATAFAAGAHPLSDAVRPEGALEFPSVAAPVRLGDSPAQVVVSLFAPDLGPEHVAVTEAFASLLAAMAARADAEARARELSARIEQRVRARTNELSALQDLALALLGAGGVAEAARLTVRIAARMLGSDVTAALLCAEGRHDITVAARGRISPALLASLQARLRDSFTALVGATHDACHPGDLELVEGGAGQGAPAAEPVRRLALASGDTLDGEPAGLLEAPVLADGRVSGLVALANMRRTAYTAEQVRLLYSIANQLATSAHHAAAARAAERQRLSALLDGLRDGVVLFDAAATVVSSNQPGRDLLAALRGTAGAPLPEAVTALLTAALQEGGPAAAQLATEDDAPRAINAVATRVDGAAGAPIAALVLHDNTDAELMRERLFQSEKMASVGRLVSGVAHELNNPLTGIMGFAQLLLLCDLDATARRQAETIYDEAERASKIVQNLLSFARRRRPEKVPVDINALVERVLELWEYEVRLKGITVCRELARRLPPCLADPHQIQQVLLNVLGNAAQAIAAAGRGETITIRTSAARGFVRIAIADDGPGVPPEHLRRVFDPFFTTKPVGEGTGLGLTISYGIVEEHGGRIAVESPAGGGAVFTIELPATVSAVAAGRPHEPEPEPAQTAHSILVVDDERSLRDLLAGILALDGHLVEVSASGEEALARMSAHDFDVVITDVRMPGMDGIELYRRMLERDPALARRIIFTSGDTVSRDTRAFVESTAVPFLPKPFTVRDVRELVANVLAKT